MHRNAIDSLARKATLYAARGLRRLGNHDPELPAQLASMAMEELIHAHHEGPDTLRLLCAVIDELLDPSAEKAN
jgi:hypothetical protein